VWHPVSFLFALSWLDRTYLSLGHAKPDERNTDVGQNSVHEEDSPAHVSYHVWCRARNAVVHDPIGKHAERHGERTLYTQSAGDKVVFRLGSL
jgi:hypothetical protein